MKPGAKSVAEAEAAALAARCRARGLAPLVLSTTIHAVADLGLATEVHRTGALHRYRREARTGLMSWRAAAQVWGPAWVAAAVVGLYLATRERLGTDPDDERLHGLLRTLHGDPDRATALAVVHTLDGTHGARDALVAWGLLR